MSQIKHITILGGTGFVGKNLAASLVKDGYKLRIPTRRREEHRELLILPGVELVQADVHNVEVLKQVVHNTDVVINLVGILNETRAASHKFKTAHVDFTARVIEACESQNIKRYLHLSALKADAENSPSEYLKTKGAAENLALKSALNVTVFRPSVIFGVNDSFVNKFSDLVKVPTPFFILPVPNARFAPVFVDDVVDAIKQSLNNRATYGQRYSCCGPKIYSMRELIQLIADTLGVKRKIIGLDAMFSKMAASIMGFLPGKPFTKDNYLSLQVNSICENNGLEKLGIVPKSMESIIPSYLKPRDENVILSQFRRLAGR